MNNADVNFNKITDLINSNNEKEYKVFEASKNLNTENNEIDIKRKWNQKFKIFRIY